ncbi:hypothetical protein PRABACTJOHN_03965 [Parabacteroides johnsonii DSM 18315]|uniref:Uncharacterized protein n=1 Tax=Parabacteroides johnsonii DSM 18315 TaxID=537006 RepID=B7BFY0_9BACT|nr:hypothetical protein PRABACTJOHN_03965 [Parabacteroides johnsonii DSM 18315]
MSIAKINKKGKLYCLQRNINRYKSKIFSNKKGDLLQPPLPIIPIAGKFPQI